MVTILLAACNGEKYIAEQIESILRQTYGNWKLVVQDDCSSDKTCEIVEKYARRHANRISLVKRSSPSGSAKNNFLSMIKFADTEYMMTCDQDDVWLPYKIEATFEKMREIEAKTGCSKPVLVHTDVKVTDDKLNVIAESLFKFQKLDSRKDKLNNLLVQNMVTGCTVMANRALLNKVQSMPEQAIMHDWWLALIASAFGHIGFVEKPTVLYRQHAGNEVGAKNVNSLPYRLQKLLALEQAKSALAATYAQAKGFMDTYKDQLTEEQLQIIAAYLSIPSVGKFKRLKIISQHDFWKTGLFRQCGQLLLT